MKLSELGEKKIVAALTSGLYSSKFVTLHAGLDDAASIRHLGEEIVFTSDIMFESTHFPKAMKPYEIGWKLAVANISDVASMGAMPLALLASFGLPSSLEMDYVKAVSKGINEACKAHECAFAGGDTKKSTELAICGSAIGVCKSEPGLLKRANMKPGDVLCVTGEICAAACGAQIALGLTHAKIPPALSSKLLKAFLKPKARVKEGMALSSLEANIAGMDITDGLFYSVNELAKTSGCGARIIKELIPFSPEAKTFAEKHAKTSLLRLMEWGEDYELLVSMRPKDFHRAQDAVKKAGGKLIKIGEAIKEKAVYLGQEKIDTKGYDAFITKG